MSVHVIRRRQIELLARLSEAAHHRDDVPLTLEEFAPSLELTIDETKFIDRGNRKSPSSDLAYDLTRLLHEGAIEATILDVELDVLGDLVLKPAVRVTAAGLATIAEETKSWLTKAIDKQPITFVQIIVTVVLAIVSGIGGWLICRYQGPHP